MARLPDDPATWTGTGRRLVLGFGAVLLALAAASALTLAGLARIERALARMDEAQAVAAVALELSSAVRDQYAHQAHTIILGNTTHLGLYGQAQRRVLQLTGALAEQVRDPARRARVRDIETASAELDAVFRGQIVPAVVAGDQPRVREAHDRAQVLVNRIQDDAERLVEAFGASIADARADALAVQRRTAGWLVALLVAAPLLALGVALAILRSIAGPLARLREGAARVASGDLDTRLAVERRDELGALAAQFNAMTGAIREHQALRVQSEKLAGIGRLAAGVAHELNNPLGVILGYARLAGRRPQADDAMREDLRVIEDEAHRAQEIVQGLLDLSRAPEPADPGREPVDLRAACDEVVARLSEARLLAGAAVAVEGAGAAPGHPARLRQVISNLVRNAAEAAGPGGHVAVRVGLDGDGVRVEVTDDGAGVAPEAAGRLFEPFFTTKARGTGLGLAISRAIARGHGGDLTAGPAEGGGARFVLTLPAPRDRAPA